MNVLWSISFVVRERSLLHNCLLNCLLSALYWYSEHICNQWKGGQSKKCFWALDLNLFQSISVKENHFKKPVVPHTNSSTKERIVSANKYAIYLLANRSQMIVLCKKNQCNVGIMYRFWKSKTQSINFSSATFGINKAKFPFNRVLLAIIQQYLSE